MTETSLPDAVKKAVAGLTFNGALNLRDTLVRPHDRFPDILNGGERIYTGLDKWTHLSALGVERNLLALGLVAPRFLPWNGPERHQGWETLCLTPLGHDVAKYLKEHWRGLTFRDGRRR